MTVTVAVTVARLCDDGGKTMLREHVPAYGSIAAMVEALGLLPLCCKPYHDGLTDEDLVHVGGCRTMAMKGYQKESASTGGDRRTGW